MKKTLAIIGLCLALLIGCGKEEVSSVAPAESEVPTIYRIEISGGGYSEWIGDERFDTTKYCTTYRADGNAYQLMDSDGEISDIIVAGPGVRVDITKIR